MSCVEMVQVVQRMQPPVQKLWASSECERWNKPTLCQTAWPPWLAWFPWVWGLWWPRGLSAIPWRYKQLRTNADIKQQKHEMSFDCWEGLQELTPVCISVSLLLSAMARSRGRGWSEPSTTPHITRTIWNKSEERNVYVEVQSHKN